MFNQNNVHPGMDHIGQSARRLKINQLIMVETGTYNPQFRRGYSTNVTGQTLDAINNRIDGVSSFTPGLFSGIAGHIVRPNAAPESPNEINIPNGWGGRRFRFMMDVEHHPITGGVQREILTGFTEHNDGVIRSTEAVDPRFMFYVSSTMTVESRAVATPLGRQSMNSVLETSQILVDNNWGIRTDDHVTRMRPTDVYSIIQRSHLDPSTGVVDTRTALSNQGVKSRRSNNLATAYTATLMDSYKNSWVETNQFGQSETNVLNSSRSRSLERTLGEDAFLQAISFIRNMPAGNMFTFGELMQLDPNVANPDVKRILFMGQAQLANTHMAGQSEGWQGADLCTSSANILSQNVIALMADLALTKCTFTATNRQFGLNVMAGVPTTLTILNLRGLINGDLSQHGAALESRIRSEVLPDLSYNDTVDYYLEMTVDMFGDTTIRLSMSGGPMCDYVVPSFCDALLTPVMTGNQHQATQLAVDFSTIFSHIEECLTPRGMSASFGSI